MSDQLLKSDAAKWFEAQAVYRDASDRFVKAQTEVHGARKRMDDLAVSLGTRVDRNVRSVMVRVPEYERTLVIRHRDGFNEPDIEVFDRDGKQL